MALSQTVQIIVNVVNNATQQMGQIVGGVNNLRASLTSMSEAAMDTARMGAILSAAFALPVSVNTEFEKEMSSVRAITQATDTEFQQLKDTAIQMGRETLYTTTEAAKGLTILAQAGFNTQESMKALPEVIALAIQGAMSLDDAASIATQTVRGMGLEVDQLAKVNDVLAVGAAKTNVSVKELGESMKIAGPAAKGSKESLEDVVTVIGTLGDAGIKGSSAGNNVKRMLVALQNETPKTKNALAELGVVTKDAEGNFRGLIPVLADLAEANMGMGDSAKIFGLYSASAALALTNQKDKMMTLRDEMYETDGASKRMANTMRDNLAGAIKNAQASLQNLSITVTDSLMVPLKTLVNLFVGITNAVSAFLGTLGPLPGILFSVVGVLGVLGTAFGGGAYLILGFARAIEGLKIAGGVAGILSKLQASFMAIPGIMGASTAAIGTQVSALGMLRAAATSAWAAMSRIPVLGWLAIAATGLTVLYNAFKETTAELSKTAAAILDSKTKTEDYVNTMKKGTEAEADNVKAKKMGVDAAKRLITHLGEMADGNKKLSVEAKAAANSIDKNTGAITDGGVALKAYNDKLDKVQYETAAKKMQLLSQAYTDASRSAGEMTTGTGLLGTGLGLIATGLTRTTIGTTAYASGMGVVNNATLVMAETSLGLSAKLLGLGAGLGVATGAAISFFQGFSEASGDFGDKFSAGLRKIYTDTVAAWQNIKTITRAFMDSVSDWGFGQKFDFFGHLMKIQEADKQKAKEDVAAAVKETLEYGIKSGKISPEWGQDTFKAWLDQNKQLTAGGNTEIEDMYKQHWTKVHGEFLRASLDITTNQRDTFAQRKDELKRQSDEELAIIVDLQKKKAEAQATVNTMKATNDPGLKAAMEEEARLYKELKAAQEDHAKTSKSLGDVKMQLAKSTSDYADELQKDIDAQVANISVKQKAYEEEKNNFANLKKLREEAVASKGAGSKEVLDLEVKMADSYQKQISLLAELTIKQKELLPDLRARKQLIQDEIKTNEDLYKSINTIFGNAYPKAHAAAKESSKDMTDGMKQGEQDLTNLTVEELIKRTAEDKVQMKERAEEAAKFIKSQADMYQKMYDDALTSARAYHKERLALEREGAKENTDLAAKEREVARESMTQAEKVADIEKEVGELRAKQAADLEKTLAALRERTAAQQAYNDLVNKQAAEGDRGGNKNEQLAAKKAAEDRLKIANEESTSMKKIWDDTTAKIISVEDSLTKQKKSRAEERVKIETAAAEKQAAAHGKALSDQDKADIAYNAKVSSATVSGTKLTAQQKENAARIKDSAAHFAKERAIERTELEKSLAIDKDKNLKLQKFDAETAAKKEANLKKLEALQTTAASNAAQRAQMAAEIDKTESVAKVQVKTAQENLNDTLLKQNEIMEKLVKTLGSQYSWLEKTEKLMKSFSLKTKESKQEKIDLTNLESELGLMQALSKKHTDLKKTMESGIKPKVDKADIDAVQTAFDKLKDSKMEEGDFSKVVSMITKALDSGDKDWAKKLQADLQNMGLSADQVAKAMDLAKSEMKLFKVEGSNLGVMQSSWEKLFTTISKRDDWQEFMDSLGFVGESFQDVLDGAMTLFGDLWDTVVMVFDSIADIVNIFFADFSDGVDKSTDSTGKADKQMGLLALTMAGLGTLLKGVASVFILIGDGVMTVATIFTTAAKKIIEGWRHVGTLVGAVWESIRTKSTAPISKAFDEIDARAAATNAGIEKDWSTLSDKLTANNKKLDKMWNGEVKLDDTEYNKKMEGIKAKAADNKKKIEEPMKVNIRFTDEDSSTKVLNKVNTLFDKIQERGKTGLPLDTASATSALKEIEREMDVVRKKIETKMATPGADVTKDTNNLKQIESQYAALKTFLSTKFNMNFDATDAKKGMDAVTSAAGEVGPAVAKGAKQAATALKDTETAAKNTAQMLEFIGKDGTKMTLIAPSTANMQAAMGQVKQYLEKEGKVTITPQVDAAETQKKFEETRVEYIKIVNDINKLKLNPKSDNFKTDMEGLNKQLATLYDKLGAADFGVVTESAGKILDMQDAIKKVNSELFDLEFQSKRYGGIDFMPAAQKARYAELQTKMKYLKDEMGKEISLKVAVDKPALDASTSAVNAAVVEAGKQAQIAASDVQATLKDAGVIAFSVEGQSAAKTQEQVNKIFKSVAEEAKQVKVEVPITEAPGEAAKTGADIAKKAEEAATKDPIELKVTTDNGTAGVAAAENIKKAYAEAVNYINGLFKWMNAEMGNAITVKVDTSAAMSQINELISMITKPETKTVHVRTVQDNHDGGEVYGFSKGGVTPFAPIHRAEGGQLPGEGSFDTVPVMARPGEWWIHNEAVANWTKTFGRGFMQAINSPWSAAGKAIKSALSGGSLKANLGGYVSSFPVPSIQNFSMGGQVQPMEGLANMGKVDLEIGGKSFPVIGAVNVVEELKKTLVRERLTRSN